MSIYKLLQIFADGASGGDGGDGAGAGVTAADAGRNEGVTADDAGQRLERLGVPKDKAEKYRQRMEKKGKNPYRPAATSPNGGSENASKGDGESGQKSKSETAAPENGQSSEAGTAAGKTDWDSFMAIPENQQRLQSMMAERGRSATKAKNTADEQMGKLAPVFELLATRYGIKAGETGEFDTDAIIQAVTGDDLFFEDKALETGESVDTVKASWRKQQEQAAQQKQQRQQMLQDHFMKMQKQGEALKREFPNFDLQRELQNQDFLRLTAPDVGWDVRRAFRAVHQEEIAKQEAEAIAQRAKLDAARTVQAGQARPRENGGAQTGPVNATPDLRRMSREERLAYIRRKYPSGR